MPSFRSLLPVEIWLQHLKHRPWAPSSVSLYTTSFRSSSVIKSSIFKGEILFHYFTMFLGYGPKPSQGLSINFPTYCHADAQKRKEGGHPRSLMKIIGEKILKQALMSNFYLLEVFTIQKLCSRDGPWGPSTHVSNKKISRHSKCAPACPHSQT